jgi:hypothetical protein
LRMTQAQGIDVVVDAGARLINGAHQLVADDFCIGGRLPFGGK